MDKRVLGSTVGRVTRSVLAVLVALGLLGPGAALAHPPGITQLVSVSSQEAEGDGFSTLSAISADGRFVAFDSFSSNLVPGDTNNERDVFVHDRVTGTTERASVSSTGAQANGLSVVRDISPDGRFVVFDSFADNLVVGDTNQSFDVFVHDRQVETTERVSVASDGSQANLQSFAGEISADGRFVAFQSEGTNLVPGDTNGTTDVFVRDRQTGTTERVSVSSDEVEGNSSSVRPAISADGRFVAFESFATNLVPGDTNGQTDVFVRDRQAGTTERVSLSSAGGQGSGSRFGCGSCEPAISDDGRFVAFTAGATNLVPEDTNNEQDIFVRDRQAGTTERISVSTEGAEGSGGFQTGRPAISGDGQFVAFDSDFVNLVPGDTNGDFDVFVRDRQAGTTVRASVTTEGAQSGFESGSLFPAISADGQVVAFSSDGILAPEASHGGHAYVHDERPPADLSVAKSDSPDPALIGRELTYTVVVTNNGPAATAASLTDTLPDTVLLLSATSTQGSCIDPPGGTVTCDLGTVTSGATVTVTIVVRPTRLGPITNTVRVAGVQPDPNRTNNTDTEQTMVISHQD